MADPFGVVIVVLVVVVVIAFAMTILGFFAYYIHMKRKQSKKGESPIVEKKFGFLKHSKSMSESFRTVDSGENEPSLPTYGETSSSSGSGEHRRAVRRIKSQIQLATKSSEEGKPRSLMEPLYVSSSEELVVASKSIPSTESVTSNSNRKTKRKPRSGEQSPALRGSEDKRAKSKESSNSPPKELKSNSKSEMDEDKSSLSVISNLSHDSLKV